MLGQGRVPKCGAIESRSSWVANEWFRLLLGVFWLTSCVDVDGHLRFSQGSAGDISSSNGPGIRSLKGIEFALCQEKEADVCIWACLGQFRTLPLDIERLLLNDPTVF